MAPPHMHNRRLAWEPVLALAGARAYHARCTARSAGCGSGAMAIDLVLRGGTVVDGSGAPGFTADVAISGDRIVEGGKVAGRGKREIDSGGLPVPPGFVDVHTHMDAQIHWDPLGTPSCFHGVTSVVMGNCGL